MASTKEMRARIRELADPARDDFDRAVIAVVDDLEALLRGEELEILHRATDRMGWPEINAFKAEMSKGQGVYEDAGGYFMRGLRRLFGLPALDEEVITYRKAAAAMVEAAQAESE